MWDDVTSNASTKHPKIVVYSIKDKVVGVERNKGKTAQVTRITQKSRPCTLILARLVGWGLELLVVREAALRGWIGSRD